MKIFKNLIHFSTARPKFIVSIVIAAAIFFGMQFPKITIDTDPENMLSEKEFVRIFHHEVKKEFGLYDFIVVGIVNEHDENGVFNPETLNRIVDLTNKIKDIQGVISYELISLSTKDNIRQGDTPGMVIFEWLMQKAPQNSKAALFIRDEAKDNPMLDGTIVSEDGKAACIYVPIEAKKESYRIAQKIKEYVKAFNGQEQFFITGLPVAEDTFGVEMFKQMAISAPLAGLIIFLIMWFFFKKISLVFSPMIVAMASIIYTMGLLIGKGFTVHIMISMIPIFLMPIAVVDSVHILSEFYDKYDQFRDRRKAIHHVMDELFMPMLYTSLTSAVGFASLAFTPIPPVKIFGLFVAYGIMMAWLLTITFIPAYIMLLKESSLSSFGKKAADHHENIFDKMLEAMGRFSQHQSKLIIAIVILILAISIYGITKININDNPVRWFTEKHDIRIADKVLNEHFGGTYTAYLVLDSVNQTHEDFKDPKVLMWVEKLQKKLISSGKVGKSTSIADVVKKVYYELLGGDKANNKIPDSRNAVAQCLLSYENSHKPDDLWHLVTTNFNKANIWIQLKSGDNQDMEQVVTVVNEFIVDNPPPVELKTGWAGLTYINTVWQEKMVKGMMSALLGSFIMVFVLMIILFRSFIWGLLCMIPLSATIIFIYGLIGLVGKDYDMPVAVLSSLTLGLSVDFAIHFLQRTKELYKRTNNWEQTLGELFKEPARAISKNALVIAIGFTPLLIAPLVPYKTVGFFMMMIMIVSAIATLFILPAIISMFRGIIFRGDRVPKIKDER
ncbi:MAG: MMPL family transporter [Candidatus Omnitrophica bacterium]|nr:MMPL family transporter [Candidatus Omnitrophota bacterium]